MVANKVNFNLLHEPWITVLREDGKTDEVSLLAVFEQAHQFRQLAGELATQDFAVLRLLLAVLHTVFSRYDPLGENTSMDEGDNPPTSREMLQRWHTLWSEGNLKQPIIRDYLLSQEDRFWLFHPERPFYQVPNLKHGTEYTSAKLNGEIGESSNKIRLFSNRGGAAKERLTYSEAARWLLYVNGYDDTSAKPKGKDLPSPGAGWLGKLGPVMAVGRNLFETLLLNLVLLKPEDLSHWATGKPVWEAERVKRDERCEIVMPSSQIELLTLQSRRLLLKREGATVSGYYLLGGDFFSPENAFVEQMTVWRHNQDKKTGPYPYKPRRHDPSRQLWRDFPTLIASQGNQTRLPGVVTWVRQLCRKRYLQHSQVQFRITAIRYGDKDFFVDDVFEDNIHFSAGLLGEQGDDWLPIVEHNIRTTDLLVGQFTKLAQNLAKASGDSDAGRLRQIAEAAREQAFFRLDMPFRRWLEQIKPDEDEPVALSLRWWNESQRVIRMLGEEWVNNCSTQALAGREVMENNKLVHYSAPKAFNQFISNISTQNKLEGRQN